MTSGDEVQTHCQHHWQSGSSSQLISLQEHKGISHVNHAPFIRRHGIQVSKTRTLGKELGYPNVAS